MSVAQFWMKYHVLINIFSLIIMMTQPFLEWWIWTFFWTRGLCPFNSFLTVSSVFWLVSGWFLQGSWIVRQSVGTTPCILGKAVDITYHRGPKYLEVTFLFPPQLHRWRYYMHNLHVQSLSTFRTQKVEHYSEKMESSDYRGEPAVVDGLYILAWLVLILALVKLVLQNPSTAPLPNFGKS